MRKITCWSLWSLSLSERSLSLSDVQAAATWLALKNEILGRSGKMGVKINDFLKATIVIAALIRLLVTKCPWYNLRIRVGRICFLMFRSSSLCSYPRSTPAAWRRRYREQTWRAPPPRASWWCRPPRRRCRRSWRSRCTGRAPHRKCRCPGIWDDSVM